MSEAERRALAEAERAFWRREQERALREYVEMARRQEDDRRGTIQPYTPPFSGRVRNWVADRLADLTGMDPRDAIRQTEKLMGRGYSNPNLSTFEDIMGQMGLLGMFGLDFPLMLGDAVESARKGDYGDAALDAGFGLLTALGLGSSVKAARKLPEVIPSDAYAVGDRLTSMGKGSGPRGRPATTAIPRADRQERDVIDARPIAPIERVAADYMRRRGLPDAPLEAYPEYDPRRAELIAAEFELMKDVSPDPRVRRSYEAMIEETMDQYRALRDLGIDFRFIPPGMPDPYARSPAMGYRDLIENGRLWVFPTDTGFGSNPAFDVSNNPLLRRVGRVGDLPNATANDAFRIVHDVFGHFGPGNPFFRHKGEERAWFEHSRMYSPEARGAMTTETRGQNSWLNAGPHATRNRTASGADTVYADQKVNLLPDWVLDPYGMPDPARMRALDEIIREWRRR